LPLNPSQLPGEQMMFRRSRMIQNNKEEVFLNLFFSIRSWSTGQYQSYQNEEKSILISWLNFGF